MRWPRRKAFIGWVDFAQSWLVRTAPWHRCTFVAPPYCLRRCNGGV